MTEMEQIESPISPQQEDRTINNAIKMRLEELGLLEPARIMILLHQPLIKSSIYQAFFHLLAPFLPNSWNKVMEPDNFINLASILVED